MRHIVLLLLWGSAAFQPAQSISPLYDTIWAYYRYPGGANAFVNLNLKTWRHHNPNMKIILVNESNIKQYVPDMPDEFFRQPYDAAKSDIVRAGLIYHNGGLYMDTDFLVMQPLEPLLTKV